MVNGSAPVIAAPDSPLCGGTLWEKISSHVYDLYSAARITPWRRDVVWCISPTRTPVACVNSSLEMLICLCANYGQRARVENLLNHPHLDVSDIHPAARADCYLYLEDRDNLAKILLESPDARAYVESLNASHVAPEITEWAQDFIQLIAVREAASDAAEEAAMPLFVPQVPLLSEHDLSAYVEYELVCTDNKVKSPSDPDYVPLEAVSSLQLEQAHRTAHSLLTYRPQVSHVHEYRGSRGEIIRIPAAAYHAPEVRLKLVNIDAATIATFANIAASIRCEFVPLDGGRRVPAEAAALLADVARRALARMTIRGSPSIDNACESESTVPAMIIEADTGNPTNAGLDRGIVEMRALAAHTPAHMATGTRPVPPNRDAGELPCFIDALAPDAPLPDWCCARAWSRGEDSGEPPKEQTAPNQRLMTLRRSGRFKA